MSMGKILFYQMFCFKLRFCAEPLTKQSTTACELLFDIEETSTLRVIFWVSTFLRGAPHVERAVNRQPGYRSKAS